ncbi:hypothetical protein R1flu_001217 [Riccia fluitans]|uniref:Membrane-associated kinase regulator 1 n=1 Tax=Riccia fluitans TaxID=41844 RepID=A0ABD1Y2P2_9MARC
MQKVSEAGRQDGEAEGVRVGSFELRDDGFRATGVVSSSRRERGGSGGRATGETHEHSCQSEVYLDMDVALPFHWENMTGKKAQHKLSKSSDSQDFEFNMTGNKPPEHLDEKEEISPADDLFYKGQLLPLHLPKRLQMVQKLSSPRQGTATSFKDKVGDPSGVTVSCFFQPSSLKYSALASDESYLGSALVNSRSSSFHSQGSKDFWESDSPGDADTGDSSSSSRDSSGSSQDACVASDKQSVRGVTSSDDHVAYNSHCSSSSKDRSFFQHRDFFSHHSLRAEKSLFTSWIRSHFKWKVLFSLRRNSKSRNSNDSSVSKVDGEGADNNNKGNLIKRDLPREAAPPLEGLPSPFSRPSRPIASSEQKVSRRKDLFSSSSGALVPVGDSSSAQAGLFAYPPSDGGFVKEKLDPSERSVSASRARESLHKYLSILKPSNGRAQPASEASDSSGHRVVDIRFSGDLSAVTAASPSSPKHSLFYPGLPSPKSSSAKSSFSDKKSPVMHSLSGNLRVPSFSRSSKASANAGSAAARAASPSHSGLLPRSSPSTMAELHSAIQGAIAHCKQSQVAQ